MANYLCDMSKAKFYLADNRLSYEYVNGERTDKLQGIRIDCVDINNAYEKLSVIVEGSTALLFDTENGAEIPTACEVQFDQLQVRPYVARNGRIAYSAKAAGVRLVQPPRGKE